MLNNNLIQSNSVIKRESPRVPLGRKTVHLSLSPESFESIRSVEKGRSPGSLILPPSHPLFQDSGMKGKNPRSRGQLTVAGTASVSHRIPI